MATTDYTITTSYMTTVDYIRGCVGGYPLTDEAIAVVLVDNDLPEDATIDTLTPKQKDFLKLGAYEQVLASPSMTASVTDTNGVWSHKEGATERNAVDQTHLKRMINAIKRKYGLLPGSIELHNLGMKVWH